MEIQSKLIFLKFWLCLRGGVVPVEVSHHFIEIVEEVEVELILFVLFFLDDFVVVLEAALIFLRGIHLVESITSGVVKA